MVIGKKKLSKMRITNLRETNQASTKTYLKKGFNGICNTEI